ncbi:MAG: glycosyltransferase [Micrococcales bacterium]|nr:glycosyltransferase [Micrococcales bacterium]
MSATPGSQRPYRVVHISSVHQWTDNRIHYREAASLVAMGYQVALIAVDNQLQAPDSGVVVLKTKRLPRWLRPWLGVARAGRLAWRTRADLFHLHDPELVWLIPIFRAMGKKVIYDAHEDFPEQVRDKDYLGPGLKPLIGLVARLLVAIGGRANAVVAATETIARRYNPDRTWVVHNYPVERLRDAEAPEAPNRPVGLCYIGDLDQVRGGFAMLDALASPGFPQGWCLLAAGPMPDHFAVQAKTHQGWAKVDHRGLLPPEQARDLLLQGQVGLLVFQDVAAHREALPNKLFEYLAAGLPVVASDFPLWREILSEPAAGQLVNPADPEAIALAVRRYAQNPDLLAEHAASARQLAKRFNWQSEAKVLGQVYQAVLGSR